MSKTKKHADGVTVVTLTKEDVQECIADCHRQLADLGLTLDRALEVRRECGCCWDWHEDWKIKDIFRALEFLDPDFGA